MPTWFDREDFELGAVYVNESDTALVYAGTVSAALARQLVQEPESIEAEPNEPVLLFHFAEDLGAETMQVRRLADGGSGVVAPWLWVSTLHNAQMGAIFQSLADRLLDDGLMDD